MPSRPPWDIKKDAENVVKRIPGVTQVINNIKELPLSDMDWQIRRAEQRAIYGDPEIGMRYGNQALPSIHIIVDNGHVRLEGVVDNQFDDTLIRTRANAVPNVFSVDDDLVVLNPQRRSRKSNLWQMGLPSKQPICVLVGAGLALPSFRFTEILRGQGKPSP